MSDFDWRQYQNDSDLKEIDAKFEQLKNIMYAMRRSATDSWRAYDRLNEERWHDEQLQKMKKERDEAIKERNLGFPLTQEEVDKTNEWQRKHDIEAHFNPKGYHGASGGGYSWEFYPTALGATCQCYCNACKDRAIQEAGSEWYNRCKQLDGVFQVIGWEAF